MNYKVAKTMLVLCVVYLVGFYVLKFFFPELLLQTITSPILIRLGEFTSKWYGYDIIVRLITSFVTFYIFACAGSGKFKLKVYQIITLIVFSIINNLFVEFLPELYTHTSIVLIMLSSLICKGNLLYTTISFGIHGYLSQFLSSIRGFETIFIHINVISGLLLNLEGLVWLLLLAIIFYIKEGKENGSISSTIS